MNVTATLHVVSVDTKVYLCSLCWYRYNPSSSSLWSSCLESHSCHWYSLRTWWGHATNEIAWLLRKMSKSFTALESKQWKSVTPFQSKGEDSCIWKPWSLQLQCCSRGTAWQGEARITKKDSISHFLHSHVWLYCHSLARLWQGQTFFFFVLLHTVFQIMTFNVNMNSNVLDNALFLVPPHYCSFKWP